MNKIELDKKIDIEVNEGCISCPFAGESICNCDEKVHPTHDYSYPVKCPLLNKTSIEVKRV